MPDFLYVAIIFLPIATAICGGIFAVLIAQAHLREVSDSTASPRPFFVVHANTVSRLVELFTSGGLIIAAVLSCIGFIDVAVFGNHRTLALFEWIGGVGDLKIIWSLRLDSLSAVMFVVVCGVSALVHVYSIGYMHRDEGRARFFAYLSLFTFMMLVLVSADNFVQLFFGWEGVGLASYLLIGFWHHKSSANAAAIKAFIVNRVGDFGLTVGLALIYFSTGSLQFDVVFAQAGMLATTETLFMGANVPLLTTICLLLFMGAMGKSAQFFLHTWLPDAMEGPTPVSALIHAATMVTAGVFLLVRCSPLFEFSPFALYVVTIIGAITAFFAATIGLVQNDIKRVIAYSTCSQLGYMFVAIGMGGYQIAIFHLFTHAFFKALLFLGAGSVIHGLQNEQDMRKMGGLLTLLPASWLLMLIGTLALTGFPLTAGYFSKDAIIEAAFISGQDGHVFAFWLILVTVFITSLYSWRLLFMTFHGVPRASTHAMAHVHESPPVMLVPLIVLAIGALTVGLFFGGWFIDAEHAPQFWSGSIYQRADNQILHLIHSVPLWVKLAPFVMMLAGFGLAWYAYMLRRDFPSKVAQAHDMIYQFLDHKWYFDEIYAFMFERPFGYFARFLWIRGDGKTIDGLGPNGIGQLVLFGTRQISRLQTGYLYHYAFAILLGLVAIVSWFILDGGR